MRKTHAIGQKAAQSIYYATEAQAARIGRPLTHWVTINFTLTEIAPVDAVSAFQKLRSNHFNKWSKRPRRGGEQPSPPTWVYVFENRRDDIVFDDLSPGADHNVHVHWAVHISNGRFYEFQNELWRWVERVTGGIKDAAAIHVTPVEDHKGLRRYLLKGTQRAWAPIYAAIAEPQGLIVGQRAGTSRNLGPTARRALWIKPSAYNGVFRTDLSDRQPPRRSAPMHAGSPSS